ncbi:MAG: hypothetical protein AAF085_10390 [Planctomycetota bacterium]
MNLPEEVASTIQPLFEVLPLEDAMRRLVPSGGMGGEALAVATAVIEDAALSGRDALKAGLWLYVDELDRSHDISQSMKDATGSYWHAIMHRREGDFWNSKYWYRNAGSHPAMRGFDPSAFVDQVEAAGGDDEELIAQQQQEWQALFEWCAQQ